MAVKDIIDKPVNPFTGNVISDREKYAHEQHVFLSSDWKVEKIMGILFYPVCGLRYRMICVNQAIGGLFLIQQGNN